MLKELSLSTSQISQFGTKWLCFSVQSRTSCAKVVESRIPSMARSARCQSSEKGESDCFRLPRLLFPPAFNEMQHLPHA